MEFQKSEMWENIFNGGAMTSSCMDKPRPQMDQHVEYVYGATLTNLLTVVLMYGQVVKFAGRNSENRKVGECFQWRSDNQLSYG